MEVFLGGRIEELNRPQDATMTGAAQDASGDNTTTNELGVTSAGESALQAAVNANDERTRAAKRELYTEALALARTRNPDNADKAATLIVEAQRIGYDDASHSKMTAHEENVELLAAQELEQTKALNALNLAGYKARSKVHVQPSTGTGRTVTYDDEGTPTGYKTVFEGGGATRSGLTPDKAMEKEMKVLDKQIEELSNKVYLSTNAKYLASDEYETDKEGLKEFTAKRDAIAAQYSKYLSGASPTPPRGGAPGSPVNADYSFYDKLK